MRSKFDEQLKKLNEEMMHMGSMIEESIQKAIEAFIHQDADSAKAIMEGDSEIDREQKKIESLCFDLLMQQQPVARDLRTISAAMKMVTDMERIGDHAADISEMTILMSSDKPYRVNIEHVKNMASETMLMLIRAIEAYVEKNNDKAHIVMKQDDVVDELFDKVKAELIDFIREHPEDGEQAEDLLMVAKYFERIGDHAADISEMTILMSSDKPYRVNIEHVKNMASETMLMLIRAIEAYVEKNNDKAHIVMKQDDVVDELFDKVKAELIDFIREHPEDGEQAEDLLMVAKYFERIGDHATNIAEWVEFALNDKVRKS